MVLKEDAETYFDMDKESPYMLKTVYVQEKRRLSYEQFLRLSIRSDLISRQLLILTIPPVSRL